MIYSFYQDFQNPAENAKGSCMKPKTFASTVTQLGVWFLRTLGKLGPQKVGLGKVQGRWE